MPTTHNQNSTYPGNGAQAGNGPSLFSDLISISSLGQPQNNDMGMWTPTTQCAACRQPRQELSAFRSGLGLLVLRLPHKLSWPYGYRRMYDQPPGPSPCAFLIPDPDAMPTCNCPCCVDVFICCTRKQVPSRLQARLP